MNNSLYVFSLRNNTTKDKLFLKFLCGYFNSKIVTFYAQKRNIIRYYKGKQPQIKIGDLYNIPLPTDKELQNKIAEMVDKIYDNFDSLNAIKEIDKILCGYYEISAKDVDYMECNIKDFQSI